MPVEQAPGVPLWRYTLRQAWTCWFCDLELWLLVTQTVSVSNCRPMLCISARLMPSCGVCVCVCPPATLVDCVKTDKRIFTIFSPSGRSTILVFPYQTAWQYTDEHLPNGGVECRWARQKSRFWANIWLHRLLLTVPAASAIHLAATEHGEFRTLVAGERPSLLIGGNNDEVYDKKP